MYKILGMPMGTAWRMTMAVPNNRCKQIANIHSHSSVLANPMTQLYTLRVGREQLFDKLLLKQIKSQGSKTNKHIGWDRKRYRHVSEEKINEQKPYLQILHVITKVRITGTYLR